MRTGGRRRGTAKNSERGGRCARPSRWDGARQGSHYRRSARRSPDRVRKRRRRPFRSALVVSASSRELLLLGRLRRVSDDPAAPSGPACAPFFRSALQTFAVTMHAGRSGRARRGLCAPRRLTRVFASTASVAEPAALYAPAVPVRRASRSSRTTCRRRPGRRRAPRMPSSMTVDARLARRGRVFGPSLPG